MGKIMYGNTTIAQNGADVNLSNLSNAGQAIIDGKANTSLSNLSTAGQSVLDGKANTSLSNLTTAGTTVLTNNADNRINARFLVVSALPANPDPNIFYFVTG